MTFPTSDGMGAVAEHTFTPEEARAIYARTVADGYNFRTARAKTPAVQKYADAMRKGEWRWAEAHPIRLSEDRRLCSDGLHRLLACAISGLPLRSLVLVGDQWRPGVYADTGQSRTLAQFLAANKYTHGSKRAAIIRAHLARVEGMRAGVTPDYASNILLHAEEMVRYAEKHAEDLDWVCSHIGTAPDKGFIASGYGVFLYEALRTDRELAMDFHRDFISHDLDEDDPLRRLKAFALRRFDATGRRLSQAATIDSFVKCWDMRLAGERLKMWKLPMWGATRFPVGWRLEDES